MTPLEYITAPPETEILAAWAWFHLEPSSGLLHVAAYIQYPLESEAQVSAVYCFGNSIRHSERAF